MDVKIIGSGDYISGFLSENDGDYIILSSLDTETSRHLVNACGTSKTLTEMQTAGALLNASWDFDESRTICECVDYPRFHRENVQCGE